ncbi:MAG: SpoIIE family protein phosphatase [Firmicutes bacterium]|nr:SpoIIE family protein phosphatase [Bacillota bacterium]
MALKLIFTVLLPVLMASALVLAEKWVFFRRLPHALKQLLIGAAFGGVVFAAATMAPTTRTSVQDMLPLAAGLLFGAPAGLISGGLGAALFYWLIPPGYAHGAAAVSIVLAGVIAAVVRHFLLDDHRTGLGSSLLVPGVVVVLHMSMVFFTNAADADVFSVVQENTLPLLAVCCGSMVLTTFAAQVTEHSGLFRHRPLVPARAQRSVNRTFQFWLLVSVLSALVFTVWFTWSMQTSATLGAVDDLLLTNLRDMQTTVREAGQAESLEQQSEAIANAAHNRHIWEEGFFIVCTQDGTIVSDRDGHPGESVTLLGYDGGAYFLEKTTYCSTVYGTEYYWAYAVQDEDIVIALLPVSEAMFSRNVGVCLLAFVEILVFAVLFSQITITVKKVVVENIQKVNSSLAKITDGDLDEKVDVRPSREFTELSADINQTVNTLKHYIEEAAARLDKELEVARQIQHSALPSVFPPYPNRPEFTIFASMDTAKEVGGDFYDFYLLDGDRLAFLIADVSGKGIPAAMFMMTAKTLLKTSAESGLPVEQVFQRANDKLCQGNDAGMFVTAWMGILQLSTGHLTFADAGHNPPLLRRRDGQFEYLRIKPNFVLAGMEGIRYRRRELQLEPGDTLYLYTDGVTEAHNCDKQLYGEDRLLSCLERNHDQDVQSLCRSVKADVDDFAGQQEQFDDITMLCLRLTPRQEAVWSAAPTQESMAQAAAFVEENLAKFGVEGKAANRMMVALDEIWCNIIRYSHARQAQLRLTRLGDSVILSFCDDGIPYNPLQAPAPDVTLPAEEREEGGLGIFMVRKLMSRVDYQYKDSRNCLTLTLRL